MDKLHKKVIRLLKDSLTDVVDALEEVQDAKRITGVVISSAFEGLSHKKRQTKLWQALHAGLTKQEQADVGPIAALTPTEAMIGTTE